MKTNILFLNYLKLSVRNLNKYKGVTFIGLCSLVLGMASFILLTLYARYELNYDSCFKKSDRIFLLGQKKIDTESGSSNSFAATSGIVAPTIKKEFQEVTYAVRTKEVESPLKYGEKVLVEQGLYADRDFLKAFSFPLKSGDKETALMNPFSIVLSESLTGKLFGDEDPIGKVILSEQGRAFTVTGIIRDIPGNTHFKFDYLISFVTMYSIRTDIESSWSIMNYNSYIHLDDHSSAGDFEKKLTAIVDKYHPQSSKNRCYFLIPIRDIRFSTEIPFMSAQTIDRKNVYMIVVIAFLIIAIACINYINLATARANTRSKEVGIRMITGATRQMLIRQFLVESFVLTFLSILISLVVVALLLPLFSKITGSGIPLQFLLDWRSIASFAGLFLAVGFLAGGYPALYISSFKPLNILKSSLGSGSPQGHLRFRNGLTVFQFCVSVILVILAVTIQQQLRFVKKQDIGYNRENILTIRSWNQESRQQSQAIKKELLKNPLISSAAVANSLPLRMSERNDITIESETGDKVVLPMVTTYFIDEDYVDLLEMQIMDGRNFSLDFASGIANQVIINETAARMAGLKNPLGKTMNKWGQTLHIIGVVKDFHFTSFKNKIEPMIFSYNPGYSNLFLIRISDKEIPQTLDYIHTTFRRFSNNFIFDYSFMDDQYAKLYKNESDLGRIILSFSILTLIIAAIGLYGLITFVIRRKTREIAIRKVMGASVLSVTGMILKSFFIPISIAVVVSLPVAWYLSREWLNGFTYRIHLGAGLITFSIFIIMMVAFFSIVGQTIKAAIAVPAISLRME